MSADQYFSLQAFNSFSLPCLTSQFIEINELSDLSKLSNILHAPFYILGEGSNTLFYDKYSPTIIKTNLKGIDVVEKEDCYLINVAAGENWHQLVCYCLDNHMYGLENLALIPGSVGAAPVQNIGAYGVEFANFCHSVTWFDFASRELTELNKEQCNFSYRESVFKHQLKNKGLITAITIALPKSWKANVSYHGLNQLKSPVTALQIFDKVVSIRKSKLPDPEKIANAGSFFKNPVVSPRQYERLADKFKQLPHYPQQDGQVKLAAGWLIEQSGLKGYHYKNVGVHINQALVLVNYGNGTGEELYQLAQHVQQAVYQKFQVLIEPEVRLIGEYGETKFKSITVNATTDD